MLPPPLSLSFNALISHIVFLLLFGSSLVVCQSTPDFTRLYSASDTTGMSVFFGGVLRLDDQLYVQAFAGGNQGTGGILRVFINGGRDPEVIIHYGQMQGPAAAMGAGTLAGNTGMLYGVSTSGAGPPAAGSLFMISPDAKTYGVLHYFRDVEGRSPYSNSAPVLDPSGNLLFGSVQYGGSFGMGAIYAFNIGGYSYITLHSFDMGYAPTGTLRWGPDSLLFGVTTSGGLFNAGTLFSVSTSGVINYLHHFSGGFHDGSTPYDSPIFASDMSTLYGTTFAGGLHGNGVLYRYILSNSTFTVLHSFAGGVSAISNPYASPVFSRSGQLIGTGSKGAAADLGGVYQIDVDGTNYQTIMAFNAETGGTPYASLHIDGDGNAVGTCSSHGASSMSGSIWKLKLKN